MGVTAGIFLASILLKEMRYLVYTAISIKVVHEQSGKVEYERERLLGIANKLMNFQSGICAWYALAIRVFVARSNSKKNYAHFTEHFPVKNTILWSRNDWNTTGLHKTDRLKSSRLVQLFLCHWKLQMKIRNFIELVHHNDK